MFRSQRVSLVKVETTLLSTRRSDQIQLRIHFKRDSGSGPFRIPVELRPRTVVFAKRDSSGFTPIFESAENAERIRAEYQDALVCKRERRKARSESAKESREPRGGNEPGLHMASVNAGDEDLYVGGSAINEGFARKLKNAGHDVEKYLYELLESAAEL